MFSLQKFLHIAINYPPFTQIHHLPYHETGDGLPSGIPWFLDGFRVIRSLDRNYWNIVNEGYRSHDCRVHLVRFCIELIKRVDLLIFLRLSWTLHFDTIYACQDRKDDIKVRCIAPVTESCVLNTSIIPATVRSV